MPTNFRQIVLNLIIFLISSAIRIKAAPYQQLPPKVGHVRVYIRLGNTPLHEIHPDLVEAFHELSFPSRALMLPENSRDEFRISTTESPPTIVNTATVHLESGEQSKPHLESTYATQNSRLINDKATENVSPDNSIFS